jgi:hypothetical protein
VADYQLYIPTLAPNFPPPGIHMSGKLETLFAQHLLVTRNSRLGQPYAHPLLWKLYLPPNLSGYHYSLTDLASLDPLGAS